jgi:hypothetical protein
MGDIREIKSVPVVPFALMIGAISAVVGFLYALIFILPFSILIGSMPVQGTSSIALGAGFGIIMLIAIPIGAFIAGFIAYAIIALIYNLLAPRIGGIKLELE